MGDYFLSVKFFRSFRTIHIDDMKKLSSLYYIHFYVFDKEALENISEKFAVCSRKCLKMKRKKYRSHGQIRNICDFS